MKKKISYTLLIIAILFLSISNLKTFNELKEYKTKYDGLYIYEDGSWDYVDEYYNFWDM